MRFQKAGFVCVSVYVGFLCSLHKCGFSLNYVTTFSLRLYCQYCQLWCRMYTHPVMHVCNCYYSLPCASSLYLILNVLPACPMFSLFHLINSASILFNSFQWSQYILYYVSCAESNFPLSSEIFVNFLIFCRFV
jgi:hypothetical protein